MAPCTSLSPSPVTSSHSCSNVNAQERTGSARTPPTCTFLLAASRRCARCVRGCVRVLRRAGYCRLAGPARARRPHDVYRGGVLAVTACYLLQECVYAYRERGDMEKLSRVMFLLLCHVTAIAKQIVFHVDADRIEALIGSLDEPAAAAAAGGAPGLPGALARRARRERARTARHAARLQRAFAGCAVLTCTLWAVFPAHAHTHQRPVDFPLWTGLDTSRTAVFACALLYTYYVTTLVGVANTTMDAFIATVLYQCKTQLKILRLNFENLWESALALSRQSGERHDAVLETQFVRCWEHYQKICSTARLAQDIFGGAILIQFGIGGWILCMAAYKLVSLAVLSVEFAAMALFISCILTELFLYCYYGTALTEESWRLADAVYGSRWAGAGARHRRLLVLLLLRVRRPLRPAAGLVVPLSLDTFVKILKSSYTFYAVLRQTK